MIGSMQISVTIKTNSRHREEVAAEEGGMVVYTKSPAVEGRANEAAIRLLAKYYRVTKSQVKLVRGHASRRKVFEIDR